MCAGCKDKAPEQGHELYKMVCRRGSVELSAIAEPGGKGRGCERPDMMYME